MSDEEGRQTPTLLQQSSANKKSQSNLPKAQRPTKELETTKEIPGEASNLTRYLSQVARQILEGSPWNKQTLTLTRPDLNWTSVNSQQRS